jgi:VWFA-related protein
MSAFEAAGRWWVRLSLLLALLPFCASSLPAQTGTNEPAASVPTFQSKVSEVLVDVVVSDAKDESVSGLAKKDFEVLEDGKPQTISLFEEHKGVRIRPAKLPAMPPDVYTNFPPLKASDSVNVLLLDALNTQVSDQSYVRAQLTRYLKTVQPGTRLAVFVLTSRLRMIQSVTTDSALLLAALNNQKLESSPRQSTMLLSGAENDANSAYTAEVMNNLAGETDVALTAMAPRGFSYMAQNKLDTRVQTTLQALQQLARYLAGIPGRKNLVWFSGSFPINVFPDANAADSFQGVRQFGAEVQRTATLLTVAQVAIYPIAAEGLVSDSQFAATANRISESRALQTSPDFGDSGQRNANYESMQTLADDTGGRAFYNTNGLDDALARAIDYGSHYYTLSYSPNNKKMDGKYRRIQVKVSGKYKFAYRRGYYADNAREFKTKKDPASDPLQPLMQRGLPDFSQILYKVRVARSSPQPGPEGAPIGDNKEFKGTFTRYKAEFAIAAGDVAFEETNDGHRRGEIEVMLVAYDRDGNALNWIARKQGISFTRQNYAAALAAGLQLQYEIDVPSEMLSKDNVYLRTGIYDLRSSNAGTLEISLHPPKETAVSAK